VLRRKAALYRELGLPMPHDANSVRYYHLLDLESIATQMHGAAFAAWLTGRLTPNELLFRLAEETGVVLLPGRGFGTPHPSARVSLANLNESDYANIGRSIRHLAIEYHNAFIAATDGVVRIPEPAPAKAPTPVLLASEL
jgi:aspartate 4-decarboxylase